jgi:hypothetical protein
MRTALLLAFAAAPLAARVPLADGRNKRAGVE